MTDFVLHSVDSDDDDSDYIPVDDEINNNKTSPISESDAAKEIHPTLSTAEEKARADKLWKLFLNDKIDNCSAETSVTQNFQVTALDSSICSQKDASKLKSDISVLEKSPVCKKEENAPIISAANSRHGKRGLDLDSLLSKMQNKKPKLTTLQKSLKDWESFKKDEGIGADLQIFNKGKRGYLERQAFLVRSDLRSFEVEKSLRLSKK